MSDTDVTFVPLTGDEEDDELIEEVWIDDDPTIERAEQLFALFLETNEAVKH